MTATLIKPSGEVMVTHKNNMVVDVGFDFIADAMCKSPSRPDIMGYIGVGKGTTAVSGTQAALVDEIGVRQSAVYAHTAGTKSFTLSTFLDAGTATGPITEAAVFNAAVAGAMLDRVVFDVINKGAADTLTVAFTFNMQ